METCNRKPGRLFMIAAGVALAAAGLAIYLPGFKAPFVFDDLPGIVENRWIRMVDISPRPLFDAAFQDFRQNRPLTNLSFALNYYFNQLDPFGYHLLNFLAFILTALGIWLLLRKILLHLGFDQYRSELASWFCALFWTVHPVNVQAVTYIIQRHASMAGAFSIWSLFFYHLSLEGKRKRKTFYFCSGLSCMLALLCKETAIMLPALLLAYKLYFFDEFKPGWARRNRTQIFLLAIFYVSALAFILRPSFRESAFDFSRMHFTASERLLTEPLVLVWYAFLTVFPFPQFLSIEHQFPLFHSFLSTPYPIIFWGIISAAVVTAIFRARRDRVISFMAVWYFGQLLVEALPLPIDLAAEQRLYLASLAIIVPAAAWPILKAQKLKPFLVLMVLAALLLGGFSWERNQLWRSPELLWRDAVKKAPLFPRPANNYCAMLSEQGKCDQARKACNIAHSLSRSLAEPYINLGVCYSKSGREDLAEQAFRVAAGLDQDSSKALFNIAMSYSIRRDYQNSIKWFLAAIDKDPFDADSHYGLAQAYRILSKPDDYEKELQETIKLRPEWSEARAQLAWVLAAKGGCAQAVKLVKSAPVLDPQLAKILEYCRGR